MSNSAATTVAPPSFISTLTPLISHPSLLPLLRSHRPLTNPSTLPQNDVYRFLSKLNTLIMSRESSVKSLQARREAWVVAREVIGMDEEGYTIGMYGKGWVGGLMPLVNTPNLPQTHLAPLLSLLATLFSLSPSYPTFSRETALPSIPKFTQMLVGILTRASTDQDWDVVEIVLPHLPGLIRLSPTPSRPLLPILLPVLQRLLITSPSPSISSSASEVLSTLHILPGKTSATTQFGTDLRLATGEAMECLGHSWNDGWMRREGEIKEMVQMGRGVSRGIVATLVGADEEAGEGVDRWIGALEGWGKLIETMLKYKTSRPVSVPMGSIVTLALKCLTISYQTPFVSYIEDGHRTKLISVLPRIWSVGMRLFGVLTMALGDHLLPWIGTILEHSIYLLEEMPKGSQSARLTLLRFYNLLLSKLHIDASSPTLHVRLLKHSLATIGGLLNPSVQARTEPVKEISGSKKGKKRMRIGEDAVVGEMEGKGGRGLNKIEGGIVVECLKLNAILHNHPSIPQHLLSYSMRLHLGLSSTLPMRSPSSISTEPTGAKKIKVALDVVLDGAMKMSGGSGSGRPWMALIVARDTNAKLSSTTTLIHPSLPPLNRPIPPTSTLLFYNDTSEEDAALTAELGFKDQSDVGEEQIPEPATKRQRVNDEVAIRADEAVTSADVLVTRAVASIVSSGPEVAVLTLPAPTEESVTIGVIASNASKTTLVQDVDMDVHSEDQIVSTRESFIWTPPVATKTNHVATAPSPVAATLQSTNQSDVVAPAGDFGKVVCYASDGEEIPAIDMGSSDDEEWNEEDQ